MRSAATGAVSNEQRDRQRPAQARLLDVHGAGGGQHDRHRHLPASGVAGALRVNATIGWLVTVLGCVALARVFARLAREMPQSDGPYGYIRATLGDIPAFLSIWCYWVSLWITNAAIATGVVGYLGEVFPVVATWSPAIVALALLWCFVVINLFGVRTGGRVQVVTTALKLLPMVAVAALGAWLLMTTPQVYTAHLPSAPLQLGSI